MTVNHKIRLRPIPEAIEELHAFLGSFFDQVCAEKRLREEVMLASHEVFTNLIRHSNHKPTDPVSCWLRSHGDGITVSFTDHGIPFDLSKQAPAIPDPANDCSFGIFMIHQLVDSLSYRSQENGANELSMSFAAKM